MTAKQLHRIGQIAVTAADVDRAAAFYREKLGMKQLMQTPTMAFFDCDGVVLMLSIPSSEQFDHPSSIIYFQVDDIAAYHQDLMQRGVDFLQKPHFVANMGDRQVWMAFFKDSEGNILALRSLIPALTSAD